MIVFAGLLVSAGLQAQKVYKDASNRVILDLTKEAGMPEGAITSEPKSWVGIPSDIGDILTDNLETGDINEKVFEKLEVAPKDINTSGGMNGGTTTMYWVAAFNGCRYLSYNGTGWRLPTQRELILMWIFKEALEDIFSDEDINGSPFALSNAVNYWSATEDPASHAWYMSFASDSNGIVSNYYTKISNYYARCVREVTTP
jgi:hypothetical protein